MARSELPVVVLDASAAVEGALRTVDGSTLSAHVVRAEEVVVPDHFHVEVAGALQRTERHREITTADAREALRQLLELHVRRVSTQPLLLEAWTMRHNLTIADALYVIIAGSPS